MTAHKILVRVPLLPPSSAKTIFVHVETPQRLLLQRSGKLVPDNNNIEIQGDILDLQSLGNQAIILLYYTVAIALIFVYIMMNV